MRGYYHGTQEGKTDPNHMTHKTEHTSKSRDRVVTGQKAYYLHAWY